MRAKALITGEIIAVLFRAVIYSICVFMLVDVFTPARWCSYMFTFVAIILQIVGPLIAIRRSKSGKDSFIAFPIIICGEVYFLIQIVTGIVLMITNCPFKWTFLIQLIFLAVYVLIFGALTSGKGYFDLLEKNVVDYTGYFKSLISKSEAAYLKENDLKKKKELKKLYEALRYSDPMSTTYELQEMDKKIGTELVSIYERVGNCSIEELREDINKIIKIIAERNFLCKHSKK